MAVKDPPKRKRALTPEQIWIRAFVEYSGTENVIRYRRANLGDVTLIRAAEVMLLGDQVSSEKCDGLGAVCVLRHESEDDEVEVTVWFVAAEMVLEILGACKVKEKTDDAA
jgi:hypothetical protein